MGITSLSFARIGLHRGVKAVEHRQFGRYMFELDMPETRLKSLSRLESYFLDLYNMTNLKTVPALWTLGFWGRVRRVPHGGRWRRSQCWLAICRAEIPNWCFQICSNFSFVGWHIWIVLFGSYIWFVLSLYIGHLLVTFDIPCFLLLYNLKISQINFTDISALYQTLLNMLRLPTRIWIQLCVVYTCLAVSIRTFFIFLFHLSLELSVWTMKLIKWFTFLFTYVLYTYLL